MIPHLAKHNDDKKWDDKDSVPSKITPYPEWRMDPQQCLWEMKSQKHLSSQFLVRILQQLTGFWQQWSTDKKMGTPSFWKQQTIASIFLLVRTEQQGPPWHWHQPSMVGKTNERARKQNPISGISHGRGIIRVFHDMTKQYWGTKLLAWNDRYWNSFH